MTRSGESGTIYKTDLTWVSAATVIGNQDLPEIGTANPGDHKTINGQNGNETINEPRTGQRTKKRTEKWQKKGAKKVPKKLPKRAPKKFLKKGLKITKVWARNHPKNSRETGLA
jgi:hypothetical protein